MLTPIERFTLDATRDGKAIIVTDQQSDWCASINTDDVDQAQVIAITERMFRVLNNIYPWVLPRG